MHWNTNATDVFVRDGAVVGVGGRDAGVPTVMFGGQRTHMTAYRRPKLEDLPRRFEDPRHCDVVFACKDIVSPPSASPTPSGKASKSASPPNPSNPPHSTGWTKHPN